MLNLNYEKHLDDHLILYKLIQFLCIFQDFMGIIKEHFNTFLKLRYIIKYRNKLLLMPNNLLFYVFYYFFFYKEFFKYLIAY